MSSVLRRRSPSTPFASGSVGAPERILRYTRAPGGVQEAVEEAIRAGRMGAAECVDWERAVEELELLRAAAPRTTRRCFWRPDHAGVLRRGRLQHRRTAAAGRRRRPRPAAEALTRLRDQARLALFRDRWQADSFQREFPDARLGHLVAADD
ncbi:hypothetical protein SMIR_40890 (plasmid) [Streptomyces mirabilis]|uniref:hypothetical protein n=1 Tax=Streptomyces mirabilis TaxID=68239 RepID=UPI001BAF7137|nr:hypothetical protein [Streptomyces mirabilis]QUW85442.1 hypothetical protein SMIR_40890 [Streptomyces mirabilis]